MREYVKEQTKELIDKDFELGVETLFAFINTFYLKEIWNEHGDELPWADGDFTFTATGGTAQETKLMRGRYTSVKAYETKTFTSFYTVTQHNYNLHFIVPKDGYSVGEVFTAKNLAQIGNQDNYNAYDKKKMRHYNTRCFFPEFKAAYDGDVAPALKEMGVRTLFTDECDFSPITSSPARVDEIKHVTKLTVNRKGIEGAAVTVLPAAGAAGPGEYEEVYCNYIVDRAFGYVLENSDGIALFAGIVNGI